MLLRDALRGRRRRRRRPGARARAARRARRGARRLPPPRRRLHARQRVGDRRSPARRSLRGVEHAPQNAMAEPGEIARFHDRCSDLMRALLEELARAPGRPRTFPEIEDALGWPRRRIASVLGGVAPRADARVRRPPPVPLPRRAAAPPPGAGSCGWTPGRRPRCAPPATTADRAPSVPVVPAGRAGSSPPDPWPPPWAGLIVSGSRAGLPLRVRTTPLWASTAAPFLRRRATRANVRVEPGSVNDAMPSASSFTACLPRQR